jgi:hypothetical protein
MSKKKNAKIYFKFQPSHSKCTLQLSDILNLMNTRNSGMHPSKTNDKELAHRLWTTLPFASVFLTPPHPSPVQI